MLEALARHDLVELEQRVAELDVAPERRETLIALTQLRGGPDVIERAIEIGGDDVRAAISRLAEVADRLSERGIAERVMPPPLLDRPRADVTIRVSGAFRDTFPDQIALLDQAARVVAALNEDDDWNELAAARRRGEALSRVFGSAPGTYGAGVSAQALDGEWSDRSDLGRTYLEGTSHAFGAGGEAQADESFPQRVEQAEAFVHVSDVAERDILDGDSAADAIGGFAAAAHAIGTDPPALYSLDTSRPQTPESSHSCGRCRPSRAWPPDEPALDRGPACATAGAARRRSRKGWMRFLLLRRPRTPFPPRLSILSFTALLPMSPSGSRSPPPTLPPHRRSATVWRMRAGGACGRAASIPLQPFSTMAGRRRPNERSSESCAPGLVPWRAPPDDDRRRPARAPASLRRQGLGRSGPPHRGGRA